MTHPQPPDNPPPQWNYPSTPPTTAPRNGFSITALALALSGLVFGLVPFTGFLALMLGALAVLFGILGWARVRRREATNRKMAITSTGLGVLVAALGIWGISITFNAMNKLGGSLQGIGQQLSPAVGAEYPSTTYRNAVPTPLPSDFTITVSILKKTCFGTAGCTVAYRINPTYMYPGSAPLTGRTLTVIHEVSGSEYGPQINNFRINNDGTATFPSQEFTSTSSFTAALTAKATSVSEN